MEIWSILFFAWALSLDAFSAGFAYGLRQIKIPFFSHLAFLIASMSCVGASMLCGHLIAQALPLIWSKRLGGLILLGMGLWWFLRAGQEKKKRIKQHELSHKNMKTVFKLRLASLAIVIQVLDEPVTADFDASGTISTKESLLLGFALSLDALGAGFGAAMAGLNGMVTITLIGVFQQLFLLSGILLGSCRYLSWLRAWSSLLASLVLCSLGIIKFYR